MIGYVALHVFLRDERNNRKQRQKRDGQRETEEKEDRRTEKGQRKKQKKRHTNRAKETKTSLLYLSKCCTAQYFISRRDGLQKNKTKQKPPKEFKRKNELPGAVVGGRSYIDIG